MADTHGKDYWEMLKRINIMKCVGSKERGNQWKGYSNKINHRILR